MLLVGGDSGAGRWGLRTDCMTVASIDEETGRTVLFGLPRNMTNFPFPEGSVHGRGSSRDGYDCEGCELNSLATWAGDHPALFKDDDDPGMDATIQGVEGITGLKINYYAMVNLAGFRGLVAAMGGLTLNVRDRDPDRRRRAGSDRHHRARRPQAQRLRDAVVRAVARCPPTTTPGWRGRSA